MSQSMKKGLIRIIEGEKMHRDDSVSPSQDDSPA